MTVTTTDAQIPVSELTRGMFVSGLDRPWTDTPYLIQGFLLETDEDIAEIGKYCQYVYIDRSKSIGQAHVPDLAPRSAIAREPLSAVDRAATVSVRTARPVEPTLRVAANRRPIQMGDGSVVMVERISEQELRHLGAKATPAAPVAPERPGSTGLIGRISGWLGRPDDARPGAAKTVAADASTGRPRLIVAQQERASLEEEVPRARVAIEQSRALLRTLIAAVHKRGQIHVHQAKEVVDKLIDSMERNPNALLWLARLKSTDSHAYAHSVQSAVYLVALGLHIGMRRDELADLSLAGLMLDIGKLRVPPEVLQKPARLTPAEFEAVKRHVQYGLDILAEQTDVPEPVLKVVARHHEREDGSGYPHGLKADAIGLHGRMAGLIDTFVAMTNPRPYAPPTTVHDSLRMLYRWRGAQFHEPLIEQFIQAIGVYPVGTLVELSTGEVAVVVAHNRVRRMKPRVLLLTGPDKSKLSKPSPLDLLYAPTRPDGAEIVIAHALPAGAFGVDGTDFYLA